MIEFINRVYRAIKNQMAADIAEGSVVECEHDAGNPCDPCKREGVECTHHLANPCPACEAQAWADRW